MHPSAERVASVLSAAGVRGQVRELPEPAPTAATAAAQLGCDVGAIANSLVFTAVFTGDSPDHSPGEVAREEEPVLVLTSGGHRVDTERTARALGATAVHRANADTVRAATGMAIGGVAPLGHPTRLRTLVDEALQAYDVVWAAAGHPHTVFPTSYDELVRITGGRPAKVGD